MTLVTIKTQEKNNAKSHERDLRSKYMWKPNELLPQGTYVLTDETLDPADLELGLEQYGDNPTLFASWVAMLEQAKEQRERKLALETLDQLTLDLMRG